MIQLTLLKSLEQKQNVVNNNRGLSCPLHTTPPAGWAKHLSQLSGLTPGHTPTLTPCKEQACPTLGSEQTKELLFVLSSPCYSRGPSKALPEFGDVFLMPTFSTGSLTTESVSRSWGAGSLPAAALGCCLSDPCPQHWAVSHFLPGETKALERKELKPLLRLKEAMHAKLLARCLVYNKHSINDS